MILGVILAGGRSRRFGAEKGTAVLAGRRLVDWVAARARPQVDGLIVNARHPIGEEAAADLPLVADAGTGFEGPLAGLLAAMGWAEAHDPACEWVASFAVDSPFFPADHVARLAAAAMEKARPAIARSAGHHHPVFGLWPMSAVADLRRAFYDEGERKLMAITSRFHAAAVDFAATPYDPYFNVNTQDDLRVAETIARDYFRPSS